MGAWWRRWWGIRGRAVFGCTGGDQCGGEIRGGMISGEGGGRGLWWEGHSLGTTLHTIIISLQNSFCESHTWRLVSWKALRALTSRWALPVYPISEDKKSNLPDEKLVEREIALNQTNRTNIVATNFEWELLNALYSLLSFFDPRCHLNACFHLSKMSLRKSEIENQHNVFWNLEKKRRNLQ